MASAPHHLPDELYELQRAEPAVFYFAQQQAPDGLLFWEIEETGAMWANSTLQRRLERSGQLPAGTGEFAATFDSAPLLEAARALPHRPPGGKKRLTPSRLQPEAHHSDAFPERLYFPHSQHEKALVFRARFLVFYDESGAPARLLCGLSEQRPAHKNSASALQAMTASTQDAIIMMDDEGRITFWNPAAERLFGYRSGEITGQNLHQVLAPERYHAEFYRRFADYKETGRGRAVNSILELQARHKNGHEIPVELSLSSVNLGEHHETIGILRDISARRNVETELRKLSKAVEQSPASILITDPNGTIEYVNQKFIEITGYSREEAIGQNPRMLKSGAQLLPFYEDLWGTITAGKTWRGELKNKRKDGHYYWESASITPIMDDEGRIINYLGIKEDITERKRSEQALRKSEERYRSIIAVSNTGAWEYNSRTKRLWCSAEYFEMLGFGREEIAAMDENHNLSKAWADLIHPEERGAATANFENFMDGPAAEGAIYENIFRMRHKAGHWVWIWSRGTSLKNSDGSYSHKILGTHINITEQKQAQKRLQESENYHRSLLKTIPDMLFVMDKAGRYLDFKAARKNLFIAPEAFINKKATDVMPPHIARQQLQAVGKALGSKQVVEFEYSLPHEEHLRHYRARVVAFGENRVIALASDITDSVNNLNRIKSLLSVQEEQNKRLRNFTHIVSHNLRNHTANMKGLFYMIENEQPELLQEEYIGMLQQAAEKLNETIHQLNEVLNMTLQTGEMTRPLSVYQAVEEGIKSIAQLAAEAEVQIYNETPETARAMAIPAYLDSIILNMLTNAIRFRSKQRPAFVRVAAGADHAQGMLRLHFTDNGMGIDLKRYREKLFGMYKTFHGHPDSHGLGLFMSKHQAKAMGGTIEVESEPGRGSTFTISLPLPDA